MSISPARALTTLAFAAAMACGTPSQAGNPNPSKEELDRATQQLLDSFCGLKSAHGFVTVTVQRSGEIEPSFMRRQLHLATGRRLRL